MDKVCVDGDENSFLRAMTPMAVLTQSILEQGNFHTPYI